MSLPKPRKRKLEFDLGTFMQMLTQGSEFRVKEGLPRGCVLTSVELKGNAVVLHLESVEFAETDEKDPQLDVTMDLFRVGTGWT